MKLLQASPSGVVPLLALPDATLLPAELRALHVYETRYRRLLADAMEGERLIAIARMQPGWQNQRYGNLPVQPCVGVGELMSHSLREDGTSDIVLRGVARARIAEVVRHAPYRLGRLVDLADVDGDAARAEAALVRIREALYFLQPMLQGHAAEIDRLLADPDRLAGRLCCITHFPEAPKQRILEADDRSERLDLIARALTAVERDRIFQRFLDTLARPRRRDSEPADEGGS